MVQDLSVRHGSAWFCLFLPVSAWACPPAWPVWAVAVAVAMAVTGPAWQACDRGRCRTLNVTGRWPKLHRKSGLGDMARGMQDAERVTEELRPRIDAVHCREYKPELERLAADRKDRAEGDKKASLERLMRDMNVDAGSSARRPAGPGRGARGTGTRGGGDGAGGANPFGPHARNEREDR